MNMQTHAPFDYTLSLNTEMKHAVLHVCVLYIFTPTGMHGFALEDDEDDVYGEAVVEYDTHHEAHDTVTADGHQTSDVLSKSSLHTAAQVSRIYICIYAYKWTMCVGKQL